ncbi:MAG: hypothetical protein ACTS46_01350 [Candidatus Hodgkinia cicadicola]
MFTNCKLADLNVTNVSAVHNVSISISYDLTFERTHHGCLRTSEYVILTHGGAWLRRCLRFHRRSRFVKSNQIVCARAPRFNEYLSISLRVCPSNDINSERNLSNVTMAFGYQRKFNRSREQLTFASVYFIRRKFLINSS